MRCPTLRCVLAVVVLGLAAEVPQVSAAAVQAPQPGAAAAQPRARRATAPAKPAARLSLDVEVTDGRGTPVAGVLVKVTGPLEREGETDTKGVVGFINLRAGTYRLRFERDGFVTLEKELALAAAGRDGNVAVTLTPAPPVAVVAAPAPAEPREEERPVGEPRTVQVTSFTEANFIGRGEPQKLSVLGCTGYSTTRLLQVRDPMENRRNDDADETLYVVAGEATLHLGGIDRPLDAGALAVIPRGMSHSLARRGRNPVIFVSVLSGPTCLGLDR